MTFITRKHISRRTLLRGAGVAVALPLLESMVPAAVPLRQTAAAPRSRFGAIYYPHGVTMDHWLPASEGRGFEFTPILAPLEPYRDRINVVSNTYAPAAYGADASAGANHERSSAVFLTAAKPNEETGIYLGESVDQVAARAIGQDTPLPSIELTVEPGGRTSPYRNTISWQSPTSPLPMEHNPQVIFEKLFGDGTTDEERQARRQQSRSLLDSVVDQIATLNGELPAGDRGRLSEYLDNVREIERRIERAEAQMDTAALEVPEAPVGVPGDFETHIELLFDLQVLAWQAEITRISTLMLAPELSNSTYPSTGIRDGFHNLSHHSFSRANMDRFAELNTYHHGRFAYLLERLAATPDGDGTLLDNSLVLYGSGMSDGNSHNHTPLPFVIAGGAAGRLEGGRHIRAPRVTHGNLLLAVLEKLGVQADSIGDSTEMLSI
jgi:hypothetical protein